MFIFINDNYIMEIFNKKKLNIIKLNVYSNIFNISCIANHKFGILFSDN
jgi:hypothetical protein